MLYDFARSKNQLRRNPRGICGLLSMGSTFLPDAICSVAKSRFLRN